MSNEPRSSLLSVIIIFIVDHIYRQTDDEDDREDEEDDMSTDEDTD